MYKNTDVDDAYDACLYIFSVLEFGSKLFVCGGVCGCVWVGGGLGVCVCVCVCW